MIVSGLRSSSKPNNFVSNSLPVLNTSFLIYLEWFLFSHLMLPDILSVPPFRLTFSSIPHSLPFPYSQSLLLTGYYMKLKVLNV